MNRSNISLSMPATGSFGEGQVTIDDLDSLTHQVKTLEAVLSSASDMSVTSLKATPACEAEGVMEDFPAEVSIEMMDGRFQFEVGGDDPDFMGVSDSMRPADLESVLETAAEKGLNAIVFDQDGIAGWIQEHVTPDPIDREGWLQKHAAPAATDRQTSEPSL